MPKRKGTGKKKNDADNIDYSSTGVTKESFTKEDITNLEKLFSVLSNDKRLKILSAAIVDDITRLKNLATELGVKNSAQIALHAKKLYDTGLLKKEGESLRDSREYVPTIPEATYIFLRLAVLFSNLLNAKYTSLEITKLMENAKITTQKLSEVATMTSFSDVSTKYEAALDEAKKSFMEYVQRFANAINVNYI